MSNPCILKWQYALNLEQYDVAQQLREKLTEVYEMMDYDLLSEDKFCESFEFFDHAKNVSFWLDLSVFLYAEIATQE